jgi:hypothetical protein
MRASAFHVTPASSVSILDIFVGFPVTRIHDGTYATRRYWKKVKEEENAKEQEKEHP